MTFQPVSSLLSWFIAIYRVKAIFHSTVLYWRLCGLNIAPIVKYSLNWDWCEWSAVGSLKQWLPNGKLLLLSLTKCHVVLAHCRQELQQKSWKTARLFLQDRDQDQMFKTKTKTFIFFVVEEPRDQDPDLEPRGLHHCTSYRSRHQKWHGDGSQSLARWKAWKYTSET